MEYDDGRMILYPLWSGVEVGRRRSKIELYKLKIIAIG